MKLQKFCDPNFVIKLNSLDDIKLSNEVNSNSVNTDKKVGEYDILNDKVHAVFSIQNHNYLLLDQNLIVLDSSITIDYYCDFPEEENEMKIFKDGTLIYEIIFFNKKPVFSLGQGDPDVFNFADRISNHLERLHQNPEIVLFEE